jgi:hypothetical protein
MRLFWHVSPCFVFFTINFLIFLILYFWVGGTADIDETGEDEDAGIGISVSIGDGVPKDLFVCSSSGMRRSFLRPFETEGVSMEEMHSLLYHTNYEDTNKGMDTNEGIKITSAVERVLEENADFSSLYESVLAALYRNSSRITPDGKKISATSFINGPDFETLRPDLLPHKRTLLPAISYVSGLDEEELIVSASAHGIGEGDAVVVRRADILGEVGVCHVLSFNVSKIVEGEEEEEEDKSGSVRIVLDHEAYDVLPDDNIVVDFAFPSKSDFVPSVYARPGIAKLATFSTLREFTDFNDVVGDDSSAVYRVVYEGNEESAVRHDMLSTFETCRVMRQLSKRCTVDARRIVIEERYEGICSEVDGFYVNMEMDECREKRQEDAAASAMVKRYIEDNVSVSMFKLV